MKRLLCIVALILANALLSAHAQGPDDQYVRIYKLIEQGDALNNADQPAAALAKYQEAQTALQRFQQVYPDWHSKVVKFRLNYLSSKVSVVAAKVPASSKPLEPATPSPAATTGTSVAV